MRIGRRSSRHPGRLPVADGGRHVPGRAADHLRYGADSLSRGGVSRHLRSACVSDVGVLGIQDGFQWLMAGDTSRVVPLTISDTGRIHFRGGAFLGISRANPTKNPKDLARVLDSLERLGGGMLLPIGGDDTALTAYKLSQAAGGALRVAHVPKTIDNDLDLPHDVWTFGYQTARQVGVEIVHNLMVDATTTG